MDTIPQIIASKTRMLVAVKKTSPHILNTAKDTGPYDLLTLCKTFFLNRLKLKAFADDKSNLIQMIEFLFDRLEIIMGKEGYASYQNFLILSLCF